MNTASFAQHGMRGREAHLLYEVPDILLVTAQIARLQAQVCLQDIAALLECHGPVAAGQYVIYCLGQLILHRAPCSISNRSVCQGPYSMLVLNSSWRFFTASSMLSSIVPCA